MKATGIVRSIDELGRLVIPKEMRNIHGIDVRDPLEFFDDGEFIKIRKYQPGCFICGEVDNVSNVLGKNICASCVEKVKSL